MAQRTRDRMRATGPAARRPPIVEAVSQPEVPVPTGGRTTLLERATAEILAVTYWFDPAPRPRPYPVTIRFSGRRLGVDGKLQPGDQFVRDETIDKVVPGSGPVSITARIQDVTPGEWVVTAHEVSATPAPRTRQERKRQAQEREVTAAVAAASASPGPIARMWRRWAPEFASSAGRADSVHTCLLPFVRAPGIVPGSWAALVTLGVLLAIVLQGVLAARDHLTVGSLWPIWLVGLAGSIVGAKVWYFALHQSDERRWEGWCIQGFITGATATAALLLLVLRVPAGVFLDTLAPGLLLGLAVGRLGCFLGGCCGGPPTASRWGVWSSDQRVGARRIPTQLLEAALSLTLGLLALEVVLRYGPAGGAVFATGLAAYTLGRQGILALRAEPRRTRWGSPITAAMAAVVLFASVAIIQSVIK